MWSFPLPSKTGSDSRCELYMLPGQKSNSRLSVAYHTIFSALGSSSHSSYVFISIVPHL